MLPAATEEHPARNSAAEAALPNLTEYKRRQLAALEQPSITQGGCPMHPGFSTELGAAGHPAPTDSFLLFPAPGPPRRRLHTSQAPFFKQAPPGSTAAARLPAGRSGEETAGAVLRTCGARNGSANICPCLCDLWSSDSPSTMTGVDGRRRSAARSAAACKGGLKV